MAKPSPNDHQSDERSGTRLDPPSANAVKFVPGSCDNVAIDASRELYTQPYHDS